MARGIKPTEDRKQVRTIAIQVRLNEYEYEELQTCLDILKDERPVSTFIRDAVNYKVKELHKHVSKA